MEDHHHDMGERVKALETVIVEMRRAQALTRVFSMKTRGLIERHEKQCGERWGRIKVLGALILGMTIGGLGLGVWNVKNGADITKMLADLAKVAAQYTK